MKKTMKRELSALEKQECAALKEIFLRHKRDSKLTQEAAAHALGFKTQGAVSQYLNGKIALNLEAASGFSMLLKCKISDFSPRLSEDAKNIIGRSFDPDLLRNSQFNEQDYDPGYEEDGLDKPRREVQSHHNFKLLSAPSRSFFYPEISEAKAAAAPVDTIDRLQLGEGERHQSDAWAGEHGFWLRVKGDSMTRPNGVSFPEGMIILVAQDIEPRSGQFIVARLDSSVTFKQYVIDAGVTFLKPLNPDYKQQEMHEYWQVVGTVVDAKWPRSIF